MVEPISDAEMEVLGALIECGTATTRVLYSKVAPNKRWARSTVVTFLRRLESKGYVEHTQRPGERAFVYRPTRRVRGARRRELKKLLYRVFGGDPLPLVSSLLDEANLTAEQIAKLHRILDDHSKRRKAKK